MFFLCYKRNSLNFCLLFQTPIPEGHILASQMSTNSVIEKTITEEEEEDRTSTTVSSGAKNSGSGPSQPRDRGGGGTISIKINGQMREVVIPNSVPQPKWWWWCDGERKEFNFKNELHLQTFTWITWRQITQQEEQTKTDLIYWKFENLCHRISLSLSLFSDAVIENERKEHLQRIQGFIWKRSKKMEILGLFSPRRTPIIDVT